MKLLCKSVCDDTRTKIKGRGWALVTSALLLFMPKCALCWAAYMSFLGSLGLVIKYQPWFLPVITIFFMVTLTKLLINCIRRKSFISFVLAVAAGLLIVMQRGSIGMDGIKILAMVLMAAAMLTDSLWVIYQQLNERASKMINMLL
jgi:hypothetical protein